MPTSQQKKQPVSQLRSLQESIHEKLNKLSNLNSEYREKQEKQFLKVFLHVMDKMSTELSQAQEQYQNIDREIEKDQKCLELSTKLSFFKNECLFLRLELEDTHNQIQQQKEKQREILKRKEQIQADLFQKSKQFYKYKLKARSYSKEFNSNAKTDQTRPNFFSIAKSDGAGKSAKKHSLSETSNSKISSFTHIRAVERGEEGDEKTTAQFRIKAAKLAKQRKILMSKSNYTGSHSNKNKICASLLV